jgi:hypothetical protein
MRLVVHVIGSGDSVLLSEQVAHYRRRDREPEFYLRTDQVLTAAGLPLDFEVDIGPKGQGLHVRSCGAVLLSIFGFDIYHIVELRLPTDETIEIALQAEYEYDHPSKRGN